MGKSADAFRTISEVADWLEVPAHVLRFWESKFTQVKPVKRAGGRRYYRPADMRLLGGIKRLLHDDGMTIKGVQKLLRDEGVSHVTALSPTLDDDDVATTPAPAPEQTRAQVLSFARPDTHAETPPDTALGPASEVPDTADTPAPERAQKPETTPAPPPETTSDLEPAPAPLEPAPAAKPKPEPESEPEPKPEPASARPATPRLPLPDLPADPPDTAPAAPGPLARLATLPRPLPADLASTLLALARRLRDAPAPKA